jgi:hypothetical protein
MQQGESFNSGASSAICGQSDVSKGLCGVLAIENQPKDRHL